MCFSYLSGMFFFSKICRTCFFLHVLRARLDKDAFFFFVRDSKLAPVSSTITFEDSGQCASSVRKRIKKSHTHTNDRQIIGSLSPSYLLIAKIVPRITIQCVSLYFCESIKINYAFSRWYIACLSRTGFCRKTITYRGVTQKCRKYENARLGMCILYIRIRFRKVINRILLGSI